jgi:hypothetical protein
LNEHTVTTVTSAAPILTMTDVQGMLTSSDLELAGTVVQHEATAANFDVPERTIVNDTTIPP